MSDKVTSQSLLDHKPTESELLAMDRLIGRFDSTTGFLRTLQVVLLDLEASEESEALGKFIPTIAKVEATVLNGEDSDSEPDTVVEPFSTIRPECKLPLLRDPIYTEQDLEENFNLGPLPSVADEQ